MSSVTEVLFATAESEMNAASGFFTITTIATILTLLAMWQYATRGYRLVDPDIVERIIPAISRVILIGIIINIIGVVLSFFVPWAGYIAFIAMIYMIFASASGRYRLSRS